MDLNCMFCVYNSYFSVFESFIMSLASLKFSYTIWWVLVLSRWLRDVEYPHHQHIQISLNHRINRYLLWFVVFLLCILKRVMKIVSHPDIFLDLIEFFEYILLLNFRCSDWLDSKTCSMRIMSSFTIFDSLFINFCLIALSNVLLKSIPNILISLLIFLIFDCVHL